MSKTISLTITVLVLLTGCEESTTDPVCAPAAGGGSTAVSAPEHVRNLRGNTGWFASPVAIDLTGDGQKEIVAAFYDVFVWDTSGTLIDQVERGTHHFGRIYAPHVVTDLDGDGIIELVVGSNEGYIAAYEWLNDSFQIKAGWPYVACCEAPEVRSLAAADLDGDGRIEVIGSTTETGELPGGGEAPRVHVIDADGQPYQPAGLTDWQAWPRYNNETGPGGDQNGYGHHGYGCYGLNVAVGNIDDDPELEVIVTNDTHEMMAFNHDGVSVQADTWYSRRSGDYDGDPMDWGTFIRWIDPDVEDRHYHDHEGEWPHPGWTMWAQWTASPPAVADLDGDGLNEVIGVANAEMDEPYHTYHYAFFVFDGDHAATGNRSMRRHAGWEHPPLSEHPFEDDDWYPPGGVPAPTIVDLSGDNRPELIAPINDGFIYCFSADGELLWRYDYSRGKDLLYASEVVVADLSGDGRPELIFGTFGEDDGDGHLVILSAAGEQLHDLELPGQDPGSGNGIGAAAAPTVTDLEGDGTLEILVLTIDHGLDVFTVPGSADNCMPWPTGRGNYLRNTIGPNTAD
ncbi:MAG: VCBS repeat-containing protein [bacterium]